jgi:hypothetical protein
MRRDISLSAAFYIEMSPTRAIVCKTQNILQANAARRFKTRMKFGVL